MSDVRNQGVSGDPIHIAPPALIATRARTHGDFNETAALADELRAALMQCPQWRDLLVRQREALSMITLKMARIVCGDPNHPDHWHDIAGYAELGLGEGGAPR